eukprot:284920-Chlamydomonas_euryale.AAC.8
MDPAVILCRIFQRLEAPPPLSRPRARQVLSYSSHFASSHTAIQTLMLYIAPAAAPRLPPRTDPPAGADARIHPQAACM